MISGDVRRKKIMPHDVMTVVDQRGRPEVHVHAALTFVWGGDPMSIKSSERDQKEIELGQFAARLRHGQIKRKDLDRVFDEFKQVVMNRMRDTGCLQAGE